MQNKTFLHIHLYDISMFALAAGVHGLLIEYSLDVTGSK